MKGLKVRDIMTKRVATVPPDLDLLAARDRMWEMDVRHLPVVNSRDRLVGVISQRDILRVFGDLAVDSSAADNGDSSEVTVSDAMSTDVETVSPNTAAIQAAHLIYRAKLGCLPVVERGKVRGIVTESDFVRLFIENE